MTWAKISDDLHSHPKWTGLSPWAKALWATGLSYVSSYHTDGLVTPGDFAGQLAVKSFGANPEAFDMFEQAAAELVAARLWNRTRKGWVYHDFLVHNPKGEDEKARKWKMQRGRELHRSAAGRRCKALVIDRDRNMCRYCGVRLLSQEQLSTLGDEDVAVRTFEHVDPDGPNHPDNVVLACPKCNNKKNQRTLDEAGMRLLPPPGSDDSGAPESGTTRGDTRGNARAFRARPDQPGTSRARDTSTSGRVGSGRVGSGEVGQGQGAGSGEGDGSVVDAVDRFRGGVA